MYADIDHTTIGVYSVEVYGWDYAKRFDVIEALDAAFGGDHDVTCDSNIARVEVTVRDHTSAGAEDMLDAVLDEILTDWEYTDFIERDRV